FFFFSSRRRHTRFSRDWSSDVCSSDLDKPLAHNGRGHHGLPPFVFAVEGFPPLSALDDRGGPNLTFRWKEYSLRRRSLGQKQPRSEERRVGKERRARGWRWPG